MRARRSTVPDRLIGRFDTLLRAIFAPPPNGLIRPSPAADLPHVELESSARAISGQLMRVNHTGEVCAQALYRGQAWTAHLPEHQALLRRAATEEVEHLTWCKERLEELGAHPSYLNPAWYAGAFALGAAFGKCGDRWNLGFLAETERQVVAHLENHLEHLPSDDLRSRAIVAQMCRDEAQHAATAVRLGAVDLPHWIRWLMRLQAKIMTRTAALI